MVEVCEVILRREIAPGIATNRTPVGDPLSYVPAGINLDETERLRCENAGFKRGDAVVLEWGIILGR